MRAENSAVPKKMLRRLRRLVLLAKTSLAKSMKAPRRVHVLEYSGFAAAKVVTLDELGRRMQEAAPGSAGHV